MADFVLVHGAYHGAWCWERLIPELQSRGHHARAVDLPIESPDAGAAEYAEVVVAAVDDPDTIVVGHSMGGLVAPLVPERAPVRKVVFLSAFLPEPGLSFNQQRERHPVDSEAQRRAAEFTDLGRGVWMIGPRTATEWFYHDAPRELAEAAVARLRPQAYRILAEVTPLREWPDVEYEYILCSGDHALNPRWAREAVRRRLRIEPVEIEGGHSPFLTKPAELAGLLHEMA